MCNARRTLSDRGRWLNCGERRVGRLQLSVMESSHRVLGGLAAPQPGMARDAHRRSAVVKPGIALDRGLVRAEYGSSPRCVDRFSAFAQRCASANVIVGPTDRYQFIVG